ncbi:MAG: 50S ribosomal protein L30 [Deltaproteobacteria bacterium]|jgi:large subunit ribosomal protein L30|nr:50S ribosomal protein L30 [Deltaproteobacteria bacterium]
MAKSLKITQTKSIIGRQPKHRRTVRALGLHRIGQTVIHSDSPAIRGMVKKVEYLLKVEEEGQSVPSAEKGLA